MGSKKKESGSPEPRKDLGQKLKSTGRVKREITSSALSQSLDSWHRKGRCSLQMNNDYW